MHALSDIRIGEEFSPSPQMKPYYYATLLISVLVGVATWYLPLAWFEGGIATILIGVPVLLIIAFVAVWIPWYYESIRYCLTGDEITLRRGVWFRRTGIVPYNRITNVDIVQGPLMRFFGISSVKIQTAGYSGQAVPEIRLDGMEKPEPLRETIMGYVRGLRPVATEGAAAPEEAADPILLELRAIRQLLEKGLR
ncbi:MAG: PH domain-containing protein [Methanomicrobiaceae archaeon]|uniref:YdbS-like PH domain-containing protein n=1 Tax=hydrocarbon metagenome TaxID=938273 RepID=A0A0W8FED7_9ZZZZ|nr:PH domain-containing protein [Methanomicrobiaceae archaeon]MDD5419097.1 PH domain-containing protein [Methanomicrobiaceae archaeon]